MGRKMQPAAEPEAAEEELSEPSAPSRPKNPHNVALKKVFEKGVAAKAAKKEKEQKKMLLVDDGQCSMTVGDLMEQENLSLPEALEVQKQLHEAATCPDPPAAAKPAKEAAKEGKSKAKAPKTPKEPKAPKAKAKSTAAPVPIHEQETQKDDDPGTTVAEPKRKHSSAPETDAEPANEFLRRKKQKQREQEEAKQRKAAPTPAPTLETITETPADKPAAKRKHPESNVPKEPDHEKDIEELMDELELNEKEAGKGKDKNKRRRKKKHSKPASSVTAPEETKDEDEEQEEESDKPEPKPTPLALPPPATRATYKRSDAFCHEQAAADPNGTKPEKARANPKAPESDHTDTASTTASSKAESGGPKPRLHRGISSDRQPSRLESGWHLD